MSIDAPFSPPRKKPNVLWWLAGGFVLLLLWFFYQLFGPNPPIIVSRETTYITEPLRPNGLPDYEKHVLEMYRDGVTPENNAAVLLWQALGPGEMDPKDYAAVAAELGLSKIPTDNERLATTHNAENRKRVAAWLQQQGRLQLTDRAVDEATVKQVLEMSPWPLSSGAEQLLDVVDKVIDDAMSRPWTSDQIPPMAKWVEENQESLNLVVKACERPKCYSPPPSLLNKEHDILIAMSLPSMQPTRNAGRALLVRAMWSLGEGREEVAWQDLLALHRLAQLLEQGCTLVDKLVAMTLSGMATDGTLTLLDSGKLTVEQVKVVRHDLASLRAFSSTADAVDRMERLTSLDVVIHIKAEGPEGLTDGVILTEMMASAANATSVDWNVVLSETNKWYDRLSSAARLSDYSAREQTLAQIDGQIRAKGQAISSANQWVVAALSRRARSELAATIVANLMITATSAAMQAEDRTNTQLELTRVSAALAEYRAEHGVYPEKLDDVVPSIYDQLPVDLFHAKPFLYKRDGDGYLLYSAGPNGKDDGGSNEQMSTLQGHELNDLPPDKLESESQKIASGADDFSVRVPRPAFELQMAPQP